MALIEKPAQMGDIRSRQGSIGTYNVYTYGVAGERFFRELKDKGRFLGTRCPECSLTYLPPRTFCERCFSSLTDWVEAPSQGTVHTFTIAYVGLDRQRLTKPEVLAVVNLDGCHGGIVHRLGEVKPQEVSIGIRVEAKLKSPKERKGSINDIRYFRPVREKKR